MHVCIYICTHIQFLICLDLYTPRMYCKPVTEILENGHIGCSESLCQRTERDPHLNLPKHPRPSTPEPALKSLNSCSKTKLLLSAPPPPPQQKNSTPKQKLNSLPPPSHKNKNKNLSLRPPPKQNTYRGAPPGSRNRRQCTDFAVASLGSEV